MGTGMLLAAILAVRIFVPVPNGEAPINDPMTAARSPTSSATASSTVTPAPTLARTSPTVTPTRPPSSPTLTATPPVTPSGPTRTPTSTPTVTGTLIRTVVPTMTATATATVEAPPLAPVFAPVPTSSPTSSSTTTPSPTTTPTPGPTTTPTPALFVLAGQSNMLRTGEIVDVARAPEDSLLVLASLRWTVEPGTSPGEIRVPNGPGLSFARALARRGHRIGLIGCALGGTTIAEWQRGEALYDECLAAVRATGLPLAGLLFAQGEADAKNAPTQGGWTPQPTRWGELFARFAAGFRADVGQPDLPVVYGRLAHTTSTDAPNWATVQAQQDGVSIPGGVLVDPEPVVLVDGVHWDAASYAAQGERLATAWLGLRP